MKVAIRHKFLYVIDELNKVHSELQHIYEVTPSGSNEEALADQCMEDIDRILDDLDRATGI